MAQKLYIVTITYEAMVLAESEQAAATMDYEIRQWDQPEVEAVEAKGRRADSWQSDDFVYHDGKGDITVEEAEAIIAGQPQKDTRTGDLFAEGGA